MDWFRWYHGTCGDAKLAGIARRLKMPRPFVIGVWAMVLESASAGVGRGRLELDADDIAATLDMRTADVERVLAEMRGPERTMIGPDGVVLNWSKRQFKSDDATGRVRSLRQRRNASETKSATARARSEPVADLFPQRPDDGPDADAPRDGNAPETESETDSPCEGDAALDAAFERFWASHPNRGAAPHNHPNPKQSARQKFRLAVQRGVDAELMIRAAAAWARADAAKDRQYVAQAQTWIQQARWEQYGAAPAASALDAGAAGRQRERYPHWLPRWIEHGDGRGWPALLGKPPTDRACLARAALGDRAVDEAVAERARRAGASTGEPA